MALSDWFGDLQIVVRWMHVIAGITWIGHLYFFNFVNVPLQAVLDDAGKKAVNSKLMPRALWWFRWSAMMTLFFGIILFFMNYLYAPGNGFGPTPLLVEIGGGITDRGWWIIMGMTLALIMWFNVWFVIWPSQQKLLGGKVFPGEAPAIRRRVFLASRTNTYLSGPMLFGMLAPNHFGAIDLPTVAVFSLIALATIWHAIQFSDKVGTTI